MVGLFPVGILYLIQKEEKTMLNLLAASNTAGTITADMLDGIKSAITSNISTVVPVAGTIMGIMLGIAIVPKIFKKFF